MNKLNMIHLPLLVRFRLHQSCFCTRSKYKLPHLRKFWNLPKFTEETPIKNKLENKSTIQNIKLPESWSQPKVVVVGAGMAGLSAAHRLLQFGLNDVTVLEATDKPGGRIQSCWFTNGVVEMGASVIQGASVANSVYNLAVSERILQSPVVREGTLKGLFYTSRGKTIDPVLSQKVFAAFREIENIAISMYESEMCPEDSNMEAFMCSHIKQEIMNFPESERQCVLMVMNAYLASLKQKTGASLNNVSSKYYGSLPSLPGGNIKIPVGFVGVLTPLIRDIPDSSILYCKSVESIQWDPCETDKPRAIVQCADETSFSADYVIITTPLGFLKDKAESLFVPNLPEKKMDAIKALGFGHLNKIFLQYSEPMWLKDEGDIMFAWDPDDYDKSDSWLKGLASLMINDNSGHVLSGVITGEEARVMETLDADQIIIDIQRHMQSFLANPTIPKPLSILRSRWSSDIHTQGAITYISKESGLDMIKDLSDPTPESEIPILLFAGEHTCPSDYATVHGARNSGIREANRIINYTNDLRGAPNRQIT